MEKLDIIKQGFESLKEDCSGVLLAGFVNKSEIPERATKEEFEGGKFDHEYNDTKSNGWDEADFWGHIYLPFYDDVYLNFEVQA